MPSKRPDWTYYSTSNKAIKPKPKCHTKHKELAIGGGVILGGGCGVPRPGYDLYVGFDQYSFTVLENSIWRGDDHVPQILYPIVDMGVPSDIADFKVFVNWLIALLEEGKRIHIGCIGGHGRTGLVIAAVLAVLGDKDAITTTRELHCKKAVESDKQVRFLVKHFGVTSVDSTKKDLFTGDLLEGTQFAAHYPIEEPEATSGTDSIIQGTRTGRTKTILPSKVPYSLFT